MFEHFLAAAAIGRDFSLFQHVGLQRLEVRVASFDIGPHATIKTTISFFDNLIQFTIGADRGRNLQAACESIHAANMSVE